jgi:hypothetical protein
MSSSLRASPSCRSAAASASCRADLLLASAAIISRRSSSSLVSASFSALRSRTTRMSQNAVCAQHTSVKAVSGGMLEQVPAQVSRNTVTSQSGTPPGCCPATKGRSKVCSAWCNTAQARTKTAGAATLDAIKGKPPFSAPSQEAGKYLRQVAGVRTHLIMHSACCAAESAACAASSCCCCSFMCSSSFALYAALPPSTLAPWSPLRDSDAALTCR